MESRKVILETICPNGVHALVVNEELPPSENYHYIQVEGHEFPFMYNTGLKHNVITVKADFSFEGKTIVLAKDSMIASCDTPS